MTLIELTVAEALHCNNLYNIYLVKSQLIKQSGEHRLCVIS